MQKLHFTPDQPEGLACSIYRVVRNLLVAFKPFCGLLYFCSIFWTRGAKKYTALTDKNKTEYISARLIARRFTRKSISTFAENQVVLVFALSTRYADLFSLSIGLPMAAMEVIAKRTAPTLSQTTLVLNDRRLENFFIGTRNT